MEKFLEYGIFKILLCVK